MDIKLTLAAVRVNAGYSQEQLADKLGVTSRTVASWEAGKTFPNTKALQEICLICDMPVECVRLQA